MTTIYTSYADMIRHSGRLQDLNSENAAERPLRNYAAPDIHQYNARQQRTKTQNKEAAGIVCNYRLLSLLVIR